MAVECFRSPAPGSGSESPDRAVNHNTNQGGAGPHGIGRGDESRVGLLLRQKLKMDNKSIKRPGGAEKHREKKLKSLEVDHLTCESLRSCFPDTGRAGRGVTLGLPFWAGLQLQI
ncbi:unnamed protein product [Pleuronectes platessa]|uniref:Uncharacterized protein n=1 Tax=Pleuronectes platessa TaxID=8262 RepID=A0A9N7YNW7_PLEPL|nr:unnamed protein product [Pleuronectes platessa]